MTVITTQPPSAHGGHGQPRRRIARLLRGRPEDPAWARPALLALLAATAVLYLAGLSRNGWANAFYAAAVQAGTQSWKALFFGSFDAANFITVDKTPAFLWVMEISARIFGLNSWSLLVPQALEGVATVGVLYATVRRWSGPAAGLEKLVSEHKIHYFVGRNQASFGGGTGDAAQITAWVAKHFTSQTIAGITVYNLTAPVSS